MSTSGHPEWFQMLIFLVFQLGKRLVNHYSFVYSRCKADLKFGWPSAKLKSVWQRVVIELAWVDRDEQRMEDLSYRKKNNKS